MSTKYTDRLRITVALITLLASLLMLGAAPSGAQASSIERNRAVFMRIIDEGFNVGQTEVLLEIFAPEFVNHSPNGDNNREGSIATIGALIAAMPDLTMTPMIVVADGDYVAGVVMLEGTFTEPMQTPAGAILPNGERIQLQMHNAMLFNADGQAIEEWLIWDNLSFLTQLGVLPGAAVSTDDPETVIRYFYELANAGDFDSQLLVWAEDAELTLPNGTVLRGRDQIATFQPGHTEIVVEDLSVEGTTVRWTSNIGGTGFRLEAVVEGGFIQSMRFR